MLFYDQVGTDAPKRFPFQFSWRFNGSLQQITDIYFFPKETPLRMIKAMTLWELQQHGRFSLTFFVSLGCFSLNEFNYHRHGIFFLVEMSSLSRGDLLFLRTAFCINSLRTWLARFSLICKTTSHRSKTNFSGWLLNFIFCCISAVKLFH